VPEPTPAQPPVLWWKSQKFTGLWQSAVVMLLLWVINGLGTNVWDWKAGLLIPVLSSAAIAFRDMWSPNVVGILPMQNTNNVK
jgi:hypothetical protein